MVASSNVREAKIVQDAFMNEALRVYTSKDVRGVEIAGSLKNVIALCCGCSDGLGYEDNTKALLMTRGMMELTTFGVHFGAEAETFSGLGGFGDLVNTCTSPHSRNRKVGELIGQGKTVEEAMEAIGITCTEELYNDYNNINSKMWKLLNEGKITLEEVLIKRFEIFLKKHQINVNPEKFKELVSKGFQESGNPILRSR